VEELTTTVGVAFTVTVVVFTFVQPPLVPDTVYTVVEDGVTLIAFVVAPVFHEYAEAPLAVNIAVLPEQMVEELTFTVGDTFTVTVDVLAFVHVPLEPVTVYTVVTDGVTAIAFVLAPVFQA
jgi:hypothetical protein